ncbi:MAG: HlyD family type I secretion periplasmic adaptor subunit [Hyphomicrobium sp.]|uniref:HlyD family type I secretion periplasmic adaptor subunit n=1 Tax=Hyphomicrobium sp. TaxID=82 RepID=UPI0039E710B4
MEIQPNKNFAISISREVAHERRPATQIGSDVDYVGITRGVRALLLAVIALVGILVALALVVKVEEIARARGEFIPVQRVQVIQTPEGGALDSVLVRNDDHVKKGDLIAKFRASDLVRDIERTRVRMAYLAIEMERLDAFASRRTPDFEQFKVEYPQMVAEALSHHTEQVHQLDQTLEQKEREIDEEKTALSAAQSEIPAAESSLNATRELLERTRYGVKKGFIPLNRLAQIEEQAAQSERTHTQLTASLDQHAARIKRLQAERAAILAKSAADARNERAGVIVQMDELKATQAAFQSRSGFIEVRAPVNGIVEKISETPVGTVIPAGGTVCEIVPTDGGVLMQAHASPRDIGFIHVGQKAIVKSDAFDFGRFGTIPGRVARIAATNTTDAQGQMPYIVVEVELDQPYVGTDKDHVVTPGMTGEATILTGEKTIFQYLLKPIYLTLDTALRER